MGYYKNKLNDETERMSLLKIGAKKRLNDCATNICDECNDRVCDESSDRIRDERVSDDFLKNIRKNIKAMVTILALLDDQEKNIDYAKKTLEKYPESDDEEAEG